ncbi:MAG TPA: flagellar basal body rod protein FlgC [Clostridia bacterium]|nr:flagellar basal body rod protein FlgC [Clostridia bacterium]
MDVLKAINISGSGLTAQRFRMDTIAQNIANADTTRTENGEPYRRRVPVFSSKNGGFLSHLKNSTESGGVRVTGVVEDQSAFKQVYDPNHPDADENGYVNYPNVDLTQEIINMMSASRSYEANVTALNTTKSMALKALEIGR